MRDIKFRAWYALESKWVTYGTALHGSVDYLQLDKETEGEYTGMKGKDGVDIYEGDIFQPLYNKLPSRVVCRGKNGKFNISNYYHSECQIIGNIHEDPELLEQA